MKPSYQSVPGVCQGRESISMSVQRYEFELYHCNGGDMVISETGDFVSHDDYSALEARCAALAAEKEKFAVECAAAKIAIAYLKSGRQDFSLNTPATDAFLDEVRAQGADECVRQLVISDDDDFSDAPNVCAMVAYQLRQEASQ